MPASKNNKNPLVFMGYRPKSLAQTSRKVYALSKAMWTNETPPFSHPTSHNSYFYVQKQYGKAYTTQTHRSD
ncbi:MAG TPA: hypothetical protein DCE42_26830 [Myxococcales bacterium]|nr:hypothetical protein [Deltaproteobacteria bacterium]HAA58407.1 hypothetical protein [Myxococcales bacterium]